MTKYKIETFLELANQHANYQFTGASNADLQNANLLASPGLGPVNWDNSVVIFVSALHG